MSFISVTLAWVLLLAGAVLGFALCALLAVGPRADLERENADLIAENSDLRRRLFARPDEEHA